MKVQKNWNVMIQNPKDSTDLFIINAINLEKILASMCEKFLSQGRSNEITTKIIDNIKQIYFSVPITQVNNQYDVY